MAHSHELAVFAFSLNSPIGIDIEKHRSSIEIMDIAKRIMTAHELNCLEDVTDKEVLFFDIWARKEAIIKATGEGFHALLTSIETLDLHGDYLSTVLDNQKKEWFIQNLELQGFSGAVASKKKFSLFKGSTRASARGRDFRAHKK
jgi:4'-phosphopantetheinyl transferase